jgi:hypothetical protein
VAQPGSRARGGRNLRADARATASCRNRR